MNTFQHFKRACRRFLAAHESGILPASKSDKLIFEVLWTGLEHICAKQAWFLDFANFAPARKHMDAFIQKRQQKQLKKLTKVIPFKEP